MTDDIVWREACMLTPSCLMNLYASGQMESILKSLPAIAVCDGRISTKSYCIYARSEEEVTQKKEAINIQPFVEKNLLRIATMGSSVLTTAANIAAMGVIDDGETIPGAIALHHQWLLVTDNLYAINLFAQRLPEISSISTIDIFKYWADTLCPGAREVEVAVKSMYKRAVYVPHTSHRWYRWWDQLRQSSSNM